MESDKTKGDTGSEARDKKDKAEQNILMGNINDNVDVQEKHEVVKGVVTLSVSSVCLDTNINVYFSPTLTSSPWYPETSSIVYYPWLEEGNIEEWNNYKGNEMWSKTAADMKGNASGP